MNSWKQTQGLLFNPHTPRFSPRSRSAPCFLTGMAASLALPFLLRGLWSHPHTLVLSRENGQCSIQPTNKQVATSPSKRNKPAHRKLTLLKQNGCDHLELCARRIFMKIHMHIPWRGWDFNVNAIIIMSFSGGRASSFSV